jgi:plexin A
MIVDDTNGAVFVGAVNRLYQLSEDLEIIKEVETGPKPSSPICSYLHCDCPADPSLKLVNNSNRLLVMDKKLRQLIVCGSLFRGACEVRSADDISHVQKESKCIHSNSEDWSIEVKIQFSVHSMLAFADSWFGTGPPTERPLIAGFSVGGFDYLVAVHRPDKSEQAVLIRSCQDQSKFLHVPDKIPLRCTGSQPNQGTVEANYNMVQAIYVGKPGSDLAKHLEVDPQEDILFAAFAQSDTTTGEQSSALCIYTLNHIRQKFSDSMEDCLRSARVAESDLPFALASRNCTRKVGSFKCCMSLHVCVCLVV